MKTTPLISTPQNAIRKTAFAPIVDSRSKILLLGSMPGEASLQKQQYYGHTGNQFWKIMFHLFNTPFSDVYEQRVQLLLHHQIALWDVLESCIRVGSADSNIQQPIANPLIPFLQQYPTIEHIVFTSSMAEQLFLKHVGTHHEKTLHKLPSPSGANAQMGITEKIVRWQLLLTLLNN
jgi:hypoxanthine-DNA glycosylase